jgi:hypothetical protein
MSLNWIRKIVLTVSGYNGGTIDLSNLRIQFNIARHTFQSPNYSWIRVYNLKKETAKVLASSVGNVVTIEAGYQDNYGPIYKGKTVWAISGRESPTDTFVDFYCLDGGDLYQDTTISKTFDPGATPNDILKYGFGQATMKSIERGVIDAPGLDKIFPKAVTYHGMFRSALTDIGKTHGARWWVDMMQLNVVRRDYKITSQIELNEETGLIGMPMTTPNNGLIITALINPAYKPGLAQIKLDSSKIQPGNWDYSTWAGVVQSQFRYETLGINDGIYDIDSVEFRGDTHAQDWYAVMHCHGALTGATPPGELSAIPEKTQ